MSIISIKNLIYEYFRRDDKGTVTEVVDALDGIDMDVQKGDFIGIIGHNGSGKSTLAKHINALLKPTEGTVSICGMDSEDSDNEWDIHKCAGMVFQNPDNQIIGNTVEEDVAFGPENLGMPVSTIWNQVEYGLTQVGMEEHRDKSPNKLSGGQKQRVAIAGILAMNPDIIVLDEATAMLDPEGRRDVINTVHKLNKEKGITVILITHYMDEVIKADKVYVMNKGQIAISGKPSHVFSKVDELLDIGLVAPSITMLAYRLNSIGISIRPGIIDSYDLVNELIKYKNDNYLFNNKDRGIKQINNRFDEESNDEVGEHSEEYIRLKKLKNSIVFNDVSFSYDGINKILSKISFSIDKNEIVAIVGPTGSGKTTLLKHFNGLLKANSGEIFVDGVDIYDKDSVLRLNEKVGLVFQYPEQQLFGETVFEDVYFGPHNMGLPKLDAQKNSFDAIKLVGLGEEVYDLSPFALSGGQKRRVAIAGVLAMNPEYLVLDEAAAGLDPAGKEEMFKLLKTLNKEAGKGIILVSHSMEEVAIFADKVIVMDAGNIVAVGSPKEIFMQDQLMHKVGLNKPEISCVMDDVKAAGFDVRSDVFTLDEAVDEIVNAITKTN